jgi:hypothetical protein
MPTSTSLMIAGVVLDYHHTALVLCHKFPFL